MTRILVTGAHGQLGRSISRAATSTRFAHLDVVALARRDCDVTDLQQVTAAVAAADPDVIVNAAGYTAVDNAEGDPETAQLLNRDAVAHLAAQGRRLIHLSTDYVFDGTKGGWYVESDPVRPLGVYGRTKWEGEEAARSNPDHAILRTSWVYSDHGNNFVRTMLRLGAERPELRVVADQFGCPTNADDLAAAILQLVETDATGTFHVAGADATSWHEFAAAVIEEAGFDVAVEPITTVDYPTPAPRPANSRLDSSMLAETTGIRLPGWQASLPDVVAAILDPSRSSA